MVAQPFDALGLAYPPVGIHLESGYSIFDFVDHTKLSVAVGYVEQNACSHAYSPRLHEPLSPSFGFSQRVSASFGSAHRSRTEENSGHEEGLYWYPSSFE